VTATSTPPNGSPSADGLYRSTGFLLAKAAAIVVGQFEDALKPYGLHSREYGALSTIHQSGPHSQQQLGEALRIDRTTMVALIDDLEQRGLLERVRDQQDRRRYAITLTAAGGALMNGGLAQIDEAVNNKFLDPLSKQQRAQLNQILSKLVADRVI